MSVNNKLIPVPFAENAGDTWKYSIPNSLTSSDESNKASYDTGFPPKTMTPIEAGGIPFFGQDVNGILNDTTTAIRYIQTGDYQVYDSDFAKSVGGYPNGAQIRGSDGIVYICTTDGNTSDPKDLKGWQAFFSSETNSTSTTQAATPSAVKSAYDLANKALPKSGGTVTGKTNFTVTPTINNAEILKKGDGGLYSSAPLLASGTDLLTDDVLNVSQTFSLSGNYLNSPNNTSSITGTLIVTRRYYDTGAAATLEINQSENVFYKSTAYKSNGSWITYGWVKDITSGNISSSLPDGTTSTKGIVQLSSATNSTSTTLAATPSAVKSAYDLASDAMPNGTGGIGLATQTATNGINIDTYAFNVGFYSGSNWSSTKGLPFGKTATDVWFYLINQNLASDGGNYKLQILGLNEIGTPRLAMRYKVKGSWTDWAEFLSTKDISDYIVQDLEYWYPNGSESNPATINTVQEIILTSPYSGKSVLFIPQIQCVSGDGDTRWYDVPFSYENHAEWGIMVANDFPSAGKIYIRGGSYKLISGFGYSGYSENYSSKDGLNSAPFRIKIIK